MRRLTGLKPLAQCLGASVALLFAVAVAAQAQERIAEIRVHGNHTTPDADVLSLSGLHVGDDAADARLEEATRALRASKRFDEVEVRRRYLSIDDPTQILIMLIVDERAGVSTADLTPGPLKRIRAGGMWMPVLSYADGYGFTYGARLAFAEPLGEHTRLSVPLTWGGERRAGVELSRQWLRGGVSTYRRVNPFYDTADTRLEARVRAEHALRSWLRAGATVRTAQVDFAGAETRHDAGGVDVAVDTRLDPTFPRNAVYLATGWERLRHELGSANRWLSDLRGYLGTGPAVVGLRVQFVTTDSPLPPSEQPLLGGADTLRGYRAGHRAADSLAAASVEVRLPVNSPLSIGRFGVKGFIDWGTAWQSGARLADQRWERGIGGGLYMGAGPVVADIAVAWPEDGGPRAHFGLGVSF